MKIKKQLIYNFLLFVLLGSCNSNASKEILLINTLSTTRTYPQNLPIKYLGVELGRVELIDKTKGVYKIVSKDENILFFEESKFKLEMTNYLLKEYAFAVDTFRYNSDLKPSKFVFHYSISNELNDKVNNAVIDFVKVLTKSIDSLKTNSNRIIDKKQ